MKLVPEIFSGYFGKCHCQGIAVDKKRGYIYYSFTTKLVKCDLEGNLIGSVDHIVGHLGCIAFNPEDGRVYASLEYKNDAIGKGILKNLGIADESLEDGFYIAIFDVDKIDRVGLNAETDGIMRAVYLRTVTDDYSGEATVGGVIHPHVDGCSGIDGLTIGPDFGYPEGRHYLLVAYGVYSDSRRTDNDHQVILQYDQRGWWDTLAKPLTQRAMHRSGPEAPRRRYYLYTGNTTYGIQNLEYDSFTGDYIACVYRGKKPNFPNYPMFIIDGSAPARGEKLLGYDPERRGLLLTLKDTGLGSDGISGVEFPYGSTGVYSLGDGGFYFSEELTDPDGSEATRVRLYTLKISESGWNFIRKT